MVFNFSEVFSCDFAAIADIFKQTLSFSFLGGFVLDFIFKNFSTIFLAFFILILVVIVVFVNFKRFKKGLKGKSSCFNCKKNCKFKKTDV